VLSTRRRHDIIRTIDLHPRHGDVFVRLDTETTICVGPMISRYIGKTTVVD
jgi:hypothetical protein